MAITDVEI